ncbi:MAG: transglutaminase domain-containing protein [Deltaproteobacteria bacterium]|nr:transglutaminase domain-containing protein [Deltaproteobacteria bacterium]
MIGAITNSFRILAVCCLLFTVHFLLPAVSEASTIILEGSMNEQIEVEQNQSFTVPPQGLKKLVFRFASPTSFASSTVNQEVKNYTLAYNPKPTSVEVETDRFGNKFTKVTWLNISGDAGVSGNFTIAIHTALKELASSAPFPLKDIDPKERRFLARTPLTQADNPEIKELANNLAKGATTEEQAVIQILNWVVDNVKYTTNPPQYDAVYTLETGTGNCQNFSHLSISLLRAVGIPARIVGGITLNKSWKVPLKNGTLIQNIGQGGHAWLEVYYPDIGWIPYDAQQSHLFVSPRHIKQTVGLDAKDINDSWLASPTLPPFREDIQANFVRDDIKLSLKDIKTNPSNYILTNAIVAHIAKPAVEIPRPEKPAPKPKAMERIEFGNMDFPSLVDIFVKAKGEERGYKTLDKETAEYVTSEYTYAQAFTITRPLKLETIALAMHKFGGRAGSLWIDVVKDDKGKPGMEGIRSFPLNLDAIKYFPGYQWFPFKFSEEPPDNPVLTPGRYWIVLRKSKDAIVNWFYIPGNPYGDPDDTRSTAQGIDWSNILNYDFNFKVTGAYLK